MMQSKSDVHIAVMSVTWARKSSLISTLRAEDRDWTQPLGLHEYRRHLYMHPLT
jgi:hypothetical protein